MSGPFGSSQWMYSSDAGGFYPYEIEQSLRFNDDDSAYLSWTPASAGNRKTWTWSGWVKLGNVSGYYHALTAGPDSNTVSSLSFSENGSSNGLNDLAFFDFQSASYTTRLVTSAVFRDASAWYHVVLTVDTTQATASDRVKIYVNGSQITSFSTETYPSQNTDLVLNNTVAHIIGAYTNTRFRHSDGYLAEVNFIDGTALDPTSFGEFKSGVWIPKEYTGSYGTNGFYLSFADSAAIGDDLSGNGNDWTPSGLASTDVLLDSPTENYCVWNHVSALTTGTLSDGNLSSTGAAIGTFSVTDFPSYWEITANAASVVGGVKNEAGTEHTTSIASSKTYGFRLDSGGDLEYRNITDAGSWTSLTTALTGDWFPYAEGGANTLNAGQATLAATPPAGFLALNTANLPEPTITPALDDVPADYFNTVLYTGTGATQSITGVGFQPDWVWIKGRSGATDHGLYDAVRGVQLQLESNTNAAETTETTGLTAFGVDGFTVGALAQLNTSTATYVAWNWKANGAGVANTDGTITSTVSANQKAGFSIVSYTGTGTNATVGHGLGAVPKMVIVKNRDQADAWQVYHGANTANPETDYLVLNSTAATVDAADRWNDALPTSSVFSIGTGAEVNTSTEDYIAYCFAEVEGFSKFGSYTGNGSADGPMVWTGHRPALIMVKRTDTTSNWTILDDVREGYNVDNDPLYPNLSNAEGTTDLADLLSNGFKLRSTDASVNASGGTYIYASFAEQPVKYSNAR
jgi:hypothetical protein